MMEIFGAFAMEGRVKDFRPYGSGHINRTYLVETEEDRRYILQRINTAIFPEPAALMRNIIRVTAHLRAKDPEPRHVLTLVPLIAGGYGLDLGEDGFWRMYDFIPGGVCLDRPETPADFRLSGKAFGSFQRQMADFPAEELYEVIPGFHDTPKRFAQLRRAIREDRAGRAASVGREIGFFLSREEGAGLLMKLLRAGELPLRVTHNDTKLNNVMLDEKTREPLCVLDLDTVMPGLAATDFGDSIRFGACTAAEDEPETEKVHLDRELYEAYARGFLGACGASLTERELETLPDGARLITLENGARFLTDYLDGDVYYHTERPGQNLDRTRTQMAMVQDMERLDKEIRAMMNRVRTEEIK